MFNFPNSPSLGDAYQPVGGPVYQWDGEKWLMAGSPLIQTPAYDQRNRIVNGAMQHSQENGNTFSTAFGFFGADQWSSSFTTTGTVNFGRVQATTPRGSVNRLGGQVTVADTSIAASEWWGITQAIEGTRIADFNWGAASARQAILRFGVFSSIAGTFGGCIRNAAANRSYIFSYTISAAEANTLVERIIAIPGDTTGTWPKDNSKGADLFFQFMAGTTIQGPVGWGTSGSAPVGITNGLATVNNVFHIFDVGLYLDPNNTGIPPAWEMPDEASELAACMRYWQRTSVLFNGTTTNAAVYYAWGSAQVPQRIMPVYSGANQVNSGFPATPGSISTYNSGGNVLVYEPRTANATASAAFFSTNVVMNARM